MQRVDRHDREEFIAALLKAVPTATRAHALRLLRWGRTYGRLAEAECNGDYPYAPVGPTCVSCDSTINEHVQRRRNADARFIAACPSCRAERIIRETCERMNLAHGGMTPNGPRCVPHFQGDPRGYTVRLQIAGAPLDAYERPALAVPTS